MKEGHLLWRTCDEEDVTLSGRAVQWLPWQTRYKNAEPSTPAPGALETGCRSPAF
jgi:hypothetical protein